MGDPLESKRSKGRCGLEPLATARLYGFDLDGLKEH